MSSTRYFLFLHCKAINVLIDVILEFLCLILIRATDIPISQIPHSVRFPYRKIYSLIRKCLVDLHVPRA
jgi:hypothetical protein